MNEKDWMIPLDTIGSHSPPANLAFSHSRIVAFSDYLLRSLARQVHSCDSDALRVLGGVGDELYLWDRRTRKTIKHFPDTHFMDVVQVRWCGPNSFVSASEDGNVAVFDLSEVICEEDSFVGAVSINSMRRMDLFGRENERLWCCSNTETLHWWDWRAACDEASTSGVDTAEALDAREQMGNAHYLIRCSQASDGSMLCFAGTAEGQVMAFGCHDQGGAIRFGTSPTSALVGGHQGVVRDVEVLGDGSVVVSCGEDGKINLWRAGDEGGGGSGGGSGGDAGRKTRYSPY